jgi:hypothetical protein
LKAKTGEVIHLKWHIQGNSKTKVSWKTIDLLFAESDKLILLKTTTQITSDQLFMHQIDFTVITPQHIVVKGFPVIVDKKNVLTSAFDLDVKPSGLPLQLNAIMPLASVEWNTLLCSWFEVLVVLFFIGMIVIISYRNFELWYQKREHLKAKQRIVNQLVALEHSANFENIATASLVRQVNELVRECENIGLNMHTINLEDQAKKLLFLPDAIAKGYCADFFNEVKRCIHTSQRLS